VLLDKLHAGENPELVTDNIYSYGYRAPRYRADFRLLVQSGDRVPALLDARCTDLSEDGLAAKTKASLEIGTTVTLIMTLPGISNSMRIAARVTNRQVEGYGFAFIFSSHNERSYMHEYLESRRSSMVRSPDLSE
jgi:PilZ domain-containing protein